MKRNLDIEIRFATAADAVAIVDLHFAAVHQTAAPFYQPEVLHGWSRQPDERRHQHMRQAIAGEEELFVVAEDHSGVVGFGSVALRSEEIPAVYVHPRVGRQGIGAGILDRLERLAIDRGVLQLQLVSSLNAEAFYRQSGYEVVERGAHRLGSGHEMACVRMRKRLSSITSG